jgi:hypothetical protein
MSAGMKSLTPQQCIELEDVIDRYSLAAVLEALASICHDKADHVLSTYNDTSLHRMWTEMGNRLSTEESAALRKFGR